MKIRLRPGSLEKMREVGPTFARIMMTDRPLVSIGSVRPSGCGTLDSYELERFIDRVRLALKDVEDNGQPEQDGEALTDAASRAVSYLKTVETTSPREHRERVSVLAELVQALGEDGE